jgi:hypothetical protein
MKQLRLRESQKRSATQIKMVPGKFRSGGVYRVTYLDKNGVVHESTGREHLEELCNKANEVKLQQTDDFSFHDMSSSRGYGMGRDRPSSMYDVGRHL